ncbi:MAG: hypothetical protein H7258_04825 [Ferruginibacter sp.]|nr:hypothetical protein [Ferruginibacter sp.]
MTVSKIFSINNIGMKTRNPHRFTGKFYCTYLLLPFTFLFVSGALFAQRDTTKKQSINIVSSFKPVLRNAVKINFSGSQLNADTSKTVKEYLIPSQNLFYAYQAISLKPLALQQDTNLYLGGRNYIKAGFGNYTTPYINVGLGIGDGKKYLANLYGTYISSNGNIRNQDYSQFNVKATGSYFLKKNELYAAASASREQYYLYGYDHLALPETKRKDISQQFQQVNVSAGVRNTASIRYGISYNPNFAANFFISKARLRETSFIIDVPVEKKIGEEFTIKIDAKADITRYATDNLLPVDVNVTNNVSQIAAALLYNSPRLVINAGIIPVWDNSKFDYLPNVSAELQLKQQVFMIQAGWVGRIIKNTYRNLAQVNPYVSTITSQTNTKEVEFYGGIKATVGKHFNFNAKAGIVHFENFALFVNDNSAGIASENKFNLVYEPKMESLRIHGDISYIHQDKFTATAGLTLNGYTGLNVNEKAWHTVPMEFKASARWWILDQLLLKGDFYLFGAGKYRETDGKSRTFSSGSDLSAGAELKITKQFSAFLDVNNIFNNKYERWHKYEVYGLNLLGGVIFHF